MDDALDDDQPLPFDAWSRTSARMLKRTRQEQASILEGLGLTSDAWRESDIHWSLALAREPASGDSTHADQHGANCAGELAARSSGAPPPRATPGLAPSSAEDAKATLDISAVLRGGPALPFAAPAPGAPPPAAAIPASSPRPPNLDVGGTVDVSDVLRGSGVPPFALPIAPPPRTTSTFAHAEQPSAPRVEEPAAPPPPPPPRPAPAPVMPVADDSKATLDISAVLRGGPALPFGAPAPGDPPAAAVPSARPLPPRPDAGGTVDVSEVLRRSGAPPLAPPPPLPQLTLKQYASLTVDLANAPAQTAETLRRYGVAPSQQAGLDAEWRVRLANHREREEFERDCAEYRAWLTRAAR